MLKSERATQMDLKTTNPNINTNTNTNLLRGNHSVFHVIVGETQI